MPGVTLYETEAIKIMARLNGSGHLSLVKRNKTHDVTFSKIDLNAEEAGRLREFLNKNKKEKGD